MTKSFGLCASAWPATGNDWKQKKIVGRIDSVVVFPLAGKSWFWKKRQDPVDAHHLKTLLLERVEAGLVRGEFLVDLAESLVYVEQEAVRHGALGLDRQGVNH